MIFKHEIPRMSWSSWPPASIKASAEFEIEIFSKLNKIVRIKPQKSSDFLPSHLPWKLPKSSAGQQASSISGSPQDAAPTTACKAAWWAKCAYHLQTKKCRMEMYGGTHLQGDRRICTMCKQDFDSIYVARPWTAKKHDIAWRHSMAKGQRPYPEVSNTFWECLRPIPNMFHLKQRQKRFQKWKHLKTLVSPSPFPYPTREAAAMRRSQVHSSHPGLSASCVSHSKLTQWPAVTSLRPRHIKVDTILASEAVLHARDIASTSMSQLLGQLL